MCSDVTVKTLNCNTFNNFRNETNVRDRSPWFQITPATRSPFCSLWHLVTLTFGLILIGGRGLAMDYLCGKFGDCSFSHFGFIVQTHARARTHTHTHTHTHTRHTQSQTAPILYSRDYRHSSSSAWIKTFDKRNYNAITRTDITYKTVINYKSYEIGKIDETRCNQRQVLLNLLCVNCDIFMTQKS